MMCVSRALEFTISNRDARSHFRRIGAGILNKHSERFYRVFNEVPTVLMIGIVILATVKPF